MRKFINRIFGGLARQAPKPIAVQLCTEHDSKKHPILAHEECTTCKINICYICAGEHVLRSHEIKLAGFINPPPPTNLTSQSVTKLIQFNRGLLAEVNTTNLKCVCGKHLDDTAAICAACATHCHSEWSKQGNCTFHLNFGDNAHKTNSLRSILFSNIRRFQKANLPAGTKTNKTSSHMVCCYLSSNPSTVFLQRGFRIYGNPHDSLFENMTLQSKNLDFYMHHERACDCDCKACEPRGHHSTANCAMFCSSRRTVSTTELLHDEQYSFECQCDCPYCKTSVVNSKHIRLNCVLDCEHSHERME